MGDREERGEREGREEAGGAREERELYTHITSGYHNR